MVVIENACFCKGETTNDAERAESMASRADVFMYNAFGAIHRAHSSTDGVVEVLKPCVFGFLLEMELDYRAKLDALTEALNEARASASPRHGATITGSKSEMYLRPSRKQVKKSVNFNRGVWHGFALYVYTR